MTREDLEAQARSDFAAVCGKFIYVTRLCGYTESGDVQERWFKPAIMVRVDPTPEDGLLHWRGDFLDPLWCVTPLESRSGMDAVHEWEMYGHSYALDGRRLLAAEFVEATMAQRMKRVIKKLM